MSTGTIRDNVHLGSFDAWDQMMDEFFRPLRQPNLQPERWQAVIDWLQDLHRGYFIAEAGPSGPWKPLHPRTIRAKGHAIRLYETSLLTDSLSNQTHQHAIREIRPDELIFGTNRPWAWIHQEGGGRIPQREHTGITEDRLDELTELVADSVIAMLFDR